MTARAALKWKIYRLTFEDGAQYVGLTMQSAESRVIEHRNHPSNAELQRRLRLGAKPAVEILSRHRSLSAARDAERDAIAALRRPLNVVGASVAPAWSDPAPSAMRHHGGLRKGRIPGDRLVACSVCRERKRAREFHADRSRSSGISSRCRTCANELRRARSEAASRGISASKAHTLMRESLRQGASR